jgi:phenylpropionate dioxygenase-like ring-hydroxylating dioxygenase large terminal subunit
MERVFHRTWQYACHGSEVADTGSYSTVDIAGQNLFVIRDRDGTIRAFFNVCKHRAHELLKGQGKVRAITCPYHAWSYGLDGRLMKAPNSEKVKGFDASAICLAEARVEVFCGFVFVNLDPRAEPMAAWYPGVEAQLREFVPHIERLQPILTVAVEEDCNWKVSVENYSECYHCRVAHPSFTKGVVDPNTYNVLPQGRCLRHTTRGAAAEKMAYTVDAESNPHAMDYSSWFLWPGISFQVYPGNILNTYFWRPRSAEKVTACRGWYCHDGVEDANILKLAEQDRNTTVAEDIELVNSVQRGLKSKGYTPGPLILDPDLGVNSEHSVKALNDWLIEALDDRQDTNLEGGERPARS